MKKIIITTILIFNIILNINAQKDFITNVPSPNAASLGSFGETSVNLNAGIKN